MDGRIFEPGRVMRKLLHGLVEIALLLLVFPGEEALFPDVGPAIAAADLGRALFEGEMVAHRIILGGRRVVEEPAEVDEMLLRGLALGQRDRLPFLDEILRGHRGRADLCEASTRLSRVGRSGEQRGGALPGNRRRRGAAARRLPVRPFNSYGTSTPGFIDPRWIEGAFRRRERLAEQGGALGAIPGHVVDGLDASHRNFLGGAERRTPSFEVHVRHVDAHLSGKLHQRGHQQGKRRREQQRHDLAVANSQ